MQRKWYIYCNQSLIAHVVQGENQPDASNAVYSRPWQGPREYTIHDAAREDTSERLGTVASAANASCVIPTRSRRF